MILGWRCCRSRCRGRGRGLSLGLGLGLSLGAMMILGLNLVAKYDYLQQI